MFIHDSLLHWVFVVIWELFIGFIIESLCEFSIRVFHSLSHFRYAARVVRVLWEFFDILYFLDHSWYTLWVWGLSNLSLRSPNQCLLHHPIMSDMIFLCCIDISWSSFFLLSLLSSYFPSFLSCYLFPLSSHSDTHAHFSIWHLSPHHSHDSSMAWPFFLFLFCFIFDISINYP